MLGKRFWRPSLAIAYHSSPENPRSSKGSPSQADGVGLDPDGHTLGRASILAVRPRAQDGDLTDPCKAVPTQSATSLTRAVLSRPGALRFPLIRGGREVGGSRCLLPSLGSGLREELSPWHFMNDPAR
jgi:hypothetical protein